MQIIYLSLFISVLVIATFVGFILISGDKEKSINVIDVKIVDELPVDHISKHTLYVLKDNDTYEKYLYINGTWEKLNKNRKEKLNMEETLSKITKIGNKYVISGKYHPILRENDVINDLRDDVTEFLDLLDKNSYDVGFGDGKIDEHNKNADQRIKSRDLIAHEILFYIDIMVAHAFDIANGANTKVPELEKTIKDKDQVIIDYHNTIQKQGDELLRLKSKLSLVEDINDSKSGEIKELNITIRTLKGNLTKAENKNKKLLEEKEEASKYKNDEAEATIMSQKTTISELKDEIKNLKDEIKKLESKKREKYVVVTPVVAEDVKVAAEPKVEVVLTEAGKAVATEATSDVTVKSPKTKRRKEIAKKIEKVEPPVEEKATVEVEIVPAKKASEQPDTIEQIRKEYKKGINPPYLMKKYNLSPTEFRQIVNDEPAPEVSKSLMLQRKMVQENKGKSAAATKTPKKK